MAINPLDPAIDELVTNTAIGNSVMQEQEDPSKDIFTGESYEVAGLGRAGRGLVEDLKRVYTQPPLPPTRPEQKEVVTEQAEVPPEAPMPVEQPSISAGPEQAQGVPETDIPNMTQEDLNEYQARLNLIDENTRTTGKPSEVGGGRLSIDTLVSDQDFADHLQAMTGVVKQDLQRISIEDVYNEALQKGWTQKDIDDLIKGGAFQTPEDAATAVIIRMRSADEVMKAREAFLKNPESLQAQVAFDRAMAYDYAIARGLQNKKTNWGRVGGVLNYTIDPSKTADEQLRNIIDRKGGAMRLRMLAWLDSRTTKPKQREWLMRVASGGKQAKDILYYHYYGAMLSSPETWQRVLGGSALFTAVRAVERPVAAGYGYLRGKFTGNPDHITAREVLLDALILPRALMDGFISAGRAAYHNKQYIGVPRMEYQTAERNPIRFGVEEGDSALTRAFKGMVNLYGLSVSIPHRAMIGFDEFFKAFNMRMELTSHATRKADQVYRAAIENGASKAEADELAGNVFNEFLLYPDEKMWDDATRLAEDATLTGRLEGGWKHLEDLANTIPTFRIAGNAFIRAPLQGGVKTAEMIPVVGPLVSQRYRNDLFMIVDKKTGRVPTAIDHDIAMARWMVGASVMTVVGAYVSDRRDALLESEDKDWGITGGMPYSDEERSVRIARGEQPFSVWYKRSRFSDEELAKFEGHPGVVITKDRVYKSYLGYEPVGALIGIAATSSEYIAINDQDTEFNEKLAMQTTSIIGDMLDKIDSMGNYAAAVGEGTSYYAADLPMLSGFGNFFESVMYREQDQSVIEALGEEYMRNLASFGILSNPTGWNAAALNYADNLFDSTRYETRGQNMNMMDYGDMPPYLRAIMDEIGAHRVNNPIVGSLTSGEKYEQYNLITGQTRQEEGSMTERALASNTTIENTDDAFKPLLMAKVAMPRIPEKIDKIPMDMQQRSDYAYAYSNLPITNEYGTPVYGGRTVAEELRMIWADEDWKQRVKSEQTDDPLVVRRIEAARQRVRDVLSAAKKSAEYYVKQKHPAIESRVLQKSISTTGKEARDDKRLEKMGY